MPSCTKLHLSLETVIKAKELGAIGIKDSSGDMSYFYSLIEAFKESPEFSIIVGTEMFLPETMLYGGHGAVAGGANFLPELFVDLYNASVANNIEDIKILRSKVAFVNNTIYCVGKNASRITKGIKCALSVMEICEDHMALPLRKFENTERERVKQFLDQFEGSKVI
tara:strand:- start:356 stop:856 length:501 start_codon:yes stop_codon:yes gene_type:complete